jgi:hypothetical protein
MHAGCVVVPVDLPDLEACRVAHSVTVSSEGIQCAGWALNNPQFYRQLGPDVRITFEASKFFTAADYVQAQCIRRRMTANLAHACERADVLVTPATPCTAPMCHQAAHHCGESDLRMVSELMKYTQLSNFVGAPAVVVPVGLDDKGLPIGYACSQTVALLSIQPLGSRIVEGNGQKENSRLFSGLFPTEKRRNASTISAATVCMLAGLYALRITMRRAPSYGCNFLGIDLRGLDVKMICHSRRHTRCCTTCQNENSLSSFFAVLLLDHDQQHCCCCFASRS